MKDCKKVAEVLISELREYLQQNNLKSVVLGISGGIDSTLVACIASEAIEGTNIKFIGRSLPTSTTDEIEFKTSILVGESFCRDFKVIDDIIEGGSGLFKSIQEAEDEPNAEERGLELSVVEKLRRGNIKSRLRMIYLYDRAKAEMGIVLGTDNYTEYLLGFSTIGGDALFDYCPIRDLWKTEVFELAKYFMDLFASRGEYMKAAAIQKSLELKPQDGLGISSCDLEQIGGKSYDEVDSVLKSVLSVANYDVSTCKGTITKEVYEGIEARYKGTAFKRVSPIITPRDHFEEGI